MQVTPLFATFFALLSLVAPLAKALQIAVPTNVTTRNVTIAFTSEATDTPGPLTFYLVKNATTTLDTLADGIDPAAGSVAVTIPANLTGAGWTIHALTFDDALAGVSLSFSIAVAPPPKAQGKNMAVGIVVGVVAGVVTLAFILLAVFLYLRRRRLQLADAGATFNIEAGFPPAHGQTHQRSFSSTSSGLVDTGNKSIELEKMQWEMELEGQFARARAGTPDPPRGGSPRGNSPLRGPSPIPLVPRRAATRDARY